MNLKRVLTAHLFLVKGFSMGTENFTRSNVGVCKADKSGRNDGKSSTCCLFIFQLPYKAPGLAPTGFTDLRIYFDTLLESARFVKKMSILFS